MCNTWFTGTLMSRLNDKRAGAIFVVSQRLHQEDLTGISLKKDGMALCCPQLPPAIPSYKSEIGAFLERGRAAAGARTPRPLEDQKRQIGAVAFAAQYLQDPVPETGNLLKLDWLKWCELPQFAIERSDRTILGHGGEGHGHQ